MPPRDHFREKVRDPVQGVEVPASPAPEETRELGDPAGEGCRLSGAETLGLRASRAPGEFSLTIGFLLLGGRRIGELDLERFVHVSGLVAHSVHRD